MCFQNMITTTLFLFLNPKGMSYRSGTDADAARIVDTFRTLGYTVKPYNDLPCKQIVDILQNGEWRIERMTVLSSLYDFLHCPLFLDMGKTRSAAGREREDKIWS